VLETEQNFIFQNRKVIFFKFL